MKLRQTLCSWAIPSKGLTGFVLKEPHTHNTATPPPLVIANWAPKCIDFCGLFQWCTIAPIAIIAAGQDGYSREGSQSCTAVSTWNWNWGLRWGWVWGTDFVVMPTLMATPGHKAPMRSHMDLELPVTLDLALTWIWSNPWTSSLGNAKTHTKIKKKNQKREWIKWEQSQTLFTRWGKYFLHRRRHTQCRTKDFAESSSHLHSHFGAEG